MPSITIMPYRAIGDKRLSLRDLRVLGVICGHASWGKKQGSERTTYLNKSTIADESGMDQREVRRCLKHLSDLHYVTKIEGLSGGRGVQVLYRVEMEETGGELPPVTEDKTGGEITPCIEDERGGDLPPVNNEKGGLSDTKGGVNYHERGGNLPLPSNEEQPQEQPQEQPHSIAQTSQTAFDDFWKLYPKKKDKDKARSSWKKKKLNRFAETIISDVKKRTATDWDWLKDDGKYVPYPSTYLNGKRWEDEITPIPSGGKTNGNATNWQDNRSRAKRVSDKLDEIARRDIEQNGLAQGLG